MLDKDAFDIEKLRISCKRPVYSQLRFEQNLQSRQCYKLLRLYLVNKLSSHTNFCMSFISELYINIYLQYSNFHIHRNIDITDKFLPSNACDLI